MIHRYFMIAAFGICLILGIQAPNFIDQYEKRIGAHYLEVVENLRGFQEIADRLHGGDLGALIGKHRSSPDATFKGEAEPIERMVARKVRFGREKEALQGPFPMKAMHVLISGDREILAETYAGYSRTFPLNRQALFSGLAAAFAICLLLESGFGLGRKALGIGRT
ncbi:MAG: hypothetical protein JWP91_1413 [Fibrobacteres bacterium]|nr:hypothetical protein [Fibrobacterota bacterium]